MGEYESCHLAAHNAQLAPPPFGLSGGGGRLSAAAGSPFFLKNPTGRDAGMEFGDVGCVRISFAINSNPFPAHSA